MDQSFYRGCMPTRTNSKCFLASDYNLASFSSFIFPHFFFFYQIILVWRAEAGLVLSGLIDFCGTIIHLQTGENVSYIGKDLNQNSYLDRMKSKTYSKKQIELSHHLMHSQLKGKKQLTSFSKRFLLFSAKETVTVGHAITFLSAVRLISLHPSYTLFSSTVPN